MERKNKNVSGYQIKIATKKNFKGAKTYTVNLTRHIRSHQEVKSKEKIFCKSTCIQDSRKI